MSLSDDKQADIIEVFNTTSRYFDDILNINDVSFDNMVRKIYLAELQLNKANNSNTGPRSAVGSLSGYRCVSDCRFRGRTFDLGLSHTFVEIDHEIISTVILLPSADSFKKGCCQLQAKLCARITS